MTGVPAAGLSSGLNLAKTAWRRAAGLFHQPVLPWFNFIKSLIQAAIMASAVIDSAQILDTVCLKPGFKADTYFFCFQAAKIKRS